MWFYWYTLIKKQCSSVRAPHNAFKWEMRVAYPAPARWLNGEEIHFMQPGSDALVKINMEFDFVDSMKIFLCYCFFKVGCVYFHASNDLHQACAEQEARGPSIQSASKICDFRQPAIILCEWAAYLVHTGTNFKVRLWFAHNRNFLNTCLFYLCANFGQYIICIKFVLKIWNWE
jgi:hypothetical protein